MGLLALLLCSLPVWGETFLIQAEGGRNSIQVHSRTQLDSFVSHTQTLSGRIELDPASPGPDLAGHAEVALESLDTGIPRRNRHMKEKVLETDRYPSVSFTLTGVRKPLPASLPDGRPVEVTVSGRLRLHGVEKQIEAPLQVIYHQARHELAITGRFSLLLSTYGIKAPRFLLLKVADEQQVSFSLSAVHR
ncbi:MAG: YceI family protein [Acidobacteria bacterium]|nr:YceI family protein [Acidobacteriota bacterium]